VNTPPSYFTDNTEEVDGFWGDIKSYELKRLLSRLKSQFNKPCMIPDVLCPWGCTKFCHRAEHCNLGLIIQHHLRKVELNMPTAEYYRKLYRVETSRLDYLREKPSEYDLVLLNDDWPITPGVCCVEGKGLMVMTCCHHGSSNTTKRLYPHVPKNQYII